ncbi:MAG TPA: hypothetical protein VIJ50_05100, partial [Solirubrobacteraceae bacterium]
MSTGSDTTVQPGSRGGLPLSWRLLAGAIGVIAIAIAGAMLLNGGGHSSPTGAVKASVAQSGGKGGPGLDGKSAHAEKHSASGQGSHAAKPGIAGRSTSVGGTGNASRTHGNSSAIPSATGGGSPAAASTGAAQGVAAAE